MASRRTFCSKGGDCCLTFNSEQQRLIEDRLEAALREAPGLERFLEDGAAELVVVKNIGSIPGDERDVVGFSTISGPGGKGELAMNFGALNKQGRERRPSVAITRARRELIVFSSISVADIDRGRTRARGVRDFRRFLDDLRRRVSPISLKSAAAP